jgi:hypothetical protein
MDADDVGELLIANLGLLIFKNGAWRRPISMTTIRSFTNQAEASLCASYLQSNQFDAVLLDEGAFQGGYGGMAISIRLQVPEEQAAAALALLETAEDEEKQHRSQD